MVNENENKNKDKGEESQNKRSKKQKSIEAVANSLDAKHHETIWSYLALESRSLRIVDTSV